MSGVGRALSLVAVAVTLLLSSMGCSDYTYFNVNVILRDSGEHFVTTDVQREIASCDIFVRHDGRLIEPGTKLMKIDGTAACKAPDTPTNVGVLNYSTAKQSGTIEFIVNMRDTADVTIVQGSQSAGVKPGEVLRVDLVAAECGNPTSNSPSCPIPEIK